MAYAIRPQSSKSQKQSFFQRKMEAYRAYGKAQSRPQSNFREYLIEKRKLNLGYVQCENKNLEAIRNFQIEPTHLPMTPASFPEEPLPINDNMYIVVDNEEQFSRMLRDLATAKEIALDLEGNTEHSYLGMTCLIQIGTYNRIYLVDPFPTYGRIKTELKSILESPKVLKIVHGGDNDYLALNRDFGISMAGVLDLQFVQQQILKLCIEIISHGDARQLKKMDVMWKSATDEDGNLLCLERLDKLSKDRIGLKSLAKRFFPSHPEPADATLTDWRIRPLTDFKMINYATYDVYILLHLWNKFKPALSMLPGDVLKNAVTSTSKLLEKPFTHKPPEQLEKKLKSAKIFPSDRKMFELIYNYVENRAKIVDESREELLKVSEIHAILKRRPTNAKQIEGIVQQSRHIPSETIKETSGSILKLLAQGEDFVRKMKDTKCHVCNAKYDYPHVAWGCVEKYSQNAVNAYMYRPENADYKKKEYERRVKNWHVKRGELNYPYPPPK